jgi:signal transduction histidine kinase/ligand-binding sensor domain-containing protein
MKRSANSRKWPRSFLIVLILLFANSVSRAEHLPVRVFTSADGLGSSFVNDLMRDSRNFLWFCTRDGLSRFDGSRFVTYQLGEKNTPGIEQILETSKGIYWIGTTEGLYRFDPNAPPAFQPSKNAERPLLNAEFVSPERGHLYEDRNGNLWFTNEARYRLEANGGQVSFQKVELNLPENQNVSLVINNIFEGPDGSVWFGTSRGLVRRLSNNREIFYSLNGRHDASYSGLIDRGGRLWLTRSSGVYVMMPQSSAELSEGATTLRNFDAQVQTPPAGKIALPEKSGEIFKYTSVPGFVGSTPDFLYQTADNHIWISTANGPVEFDGQAFHSLTAAQGFPETSGHMVEDSGGNIWISGGNGLARLDREGLTTYDAADGMSDPNPVVINETRDGQIYVASTSFLLSLFDGRKFRTIRPRVAPDAKPLWTSNTVFQDSSGEWWALTSEMLYRFAAGDFDSLARQKPLATYTHRDGLKADAAFHMFEDSEHNLWVSVRPIPGEGGLSRWNRATEKFFTFSEAEGFPSGKSPSSFAEDREGNLWFGFYEGGLVRYQHGRFTEFSTADGLPAGLITALHLDQSGRLWLASSSGGLGRIDDLTAAHLKVTHYTSENGLATNNVRSITEDLYGNIYAGTVRGVDRLSADGKYVKHYSINDGLPGDFISSAFRDRTGAIWFGAARGLARLVPKQDRQATAPPIWLSALTIAGERRPVPELGSTAISKFELSHNQNNLQIDFFGVDFTSAGALRYQYMLEGADGDWSNPTSERRVSYARLSPGTYRFLVRALNADGVVSSVPASISFKILVPTWQRWWFIALVALFSLGGLVLLASYRAARVRERKLGEEALLRSREERLVELERVRKRIASDLHDDLGSSLTQISLLSEVVQQQLADKDSAVTKPLEMIATSSRELVDAMSDIVWAINPQKDHLSDLAQRMRALASDLLMAAQIEFRFTGPSGGADIPLGANLRREVFLVFKESVNNIVRHSAASEAQIDFSLNQDELFLRVNDNGKGFDPAEENDGHGLVSMRMRSNDMGAQLEVLSARKHGTTITLRVPVRDPVSDLQFVQKASGRLRSITGPLRRRVSGKQ